MAFFIVRVELHQFNHQHANYTYLHTVMLAAGFSRIILNSLDNKWYRLPPAEYVIESTSNINYIYNTAISTVTTIDKDFAVFITKAADWQGIQWIGLKPA